MVDSINLKSVSSKDTGKGKVLKTGNLKRSYNMPGKECNQFSGAKKERCKKYQGEFAQFGKGKNKKKNNKDKVY